MGPTTAPGRRVVFVTVGTTSFDALVRAVDAEDLQAALLARGFTSLVIQIGRGKYIPREREGGEGALEARHFIFSPSLAEHMASAALVVSHAGSGSIFEALRARRPLVVVANEALMDNHQLELAAVLAAEGHLLCARPEGLARVLGGGDFGSLRPYPPAEAAQYARSIDRFLGFSDDP